MKAYVTVAESTLLIPGTDHRVVQFAIVPAGLVADVIVNQWKHHLHQLIWYRPASCSINKIQQR